MKTLVIGQFKYALKIEIIVRESAGSVVESTVGVEEEENRCYEYNTTVMLLLFNGRCAASMKSKTSLS